MSIVSERQPVTFAQAGVPRDEVGFLHDAEAMGQCMSDVKNPWNERVDALRQLQALLVGGAGRLHNFKDVMHQHLRHPLILQIGELRSVVVKEACYAVMALCRFTPPHVFEEMAGWFVAALQKQLPVTVLAISQEAQRAMRYIIEQGKVSHNVLRAIIEAARQKNSKTRARTLEHIFLIFHHVPLDSFSHHDLDALIATLAKALEDNDPIVRQFARLSYWGLEANAPVRAGELWSRLGEQHRRQITQERAAYLSIDPAVLTRGADAGAEGESGPVMAATYPPTGTARSTTPKGGSRVRSLSAAAKGGAGKRSRTPGPLTETRSVNTDKQRNPAARAGAAKKPVGAGAGVGGHNSNHAPAAASAPPPPQHHHHQPPSHDAYDEDVHMHTAVMPPPQQAPQVHGGMDVDMHAAAAPQHPQVSRNLHQQQQHQQQHVPAAMDDVAMEPAPVSYAPAHTAPPQPDERAVLDELLSSTSKHNEWEIRADSYSRIAAGVVKPECGVALANKVLEGCLNRLQSDGHFKVVTEMLLCIQRVAETYPKDTLPLLERTLTTVFACMSEKKDCVKDKARAVVDGIMGVNTVGTMFQALLKVLDCTHSKVRVACLECFLYILRFCQDYLSNGKHMKQALAKLLKVLKTPADGDVRQVEKMCTNCFQMLFRVQPNVFAAEATGLQVQQKKDLLAFVQNVLPNLRDMMMQARAKQAPAPAPAPAAVQEAPQAPPPAQQQRHSQQHHHHADPMGSMAPPEPVQHVSHQPPAPPVQAQAAAAPAPAQPQTGSDIILQLGQGTSSEMKQRALQQLLRFSVRQQQWQAHFHEVMPEVLACVSDPEYLTRCLAVAVVQMVMEHMPVQCVDVLPDILHALYRGIDDEQPDVNARAREAILKATYLPPQPVLAAALAQIPRMSDRTLQVVLCNVFPKVIAGAMPLDQGAADAITRLIHESIQSDLTDLRKAATWCLVDLYILSRPIVIHICRGLSPAKIRLLDFYISKRGGQSDLATEIEAAGY